MTTTQPVPGDRYRPLAFRGWQPTSAGEIDFAFDGAIARIALGPDGSVRLRAALGDELPPDPHEALGRAAWRSAAGELRENDDATLTLWHEGPLGSVRVDIRPDPLTLGIGDRHGEPIAMLGGLHFDARGGARIKQMLGPGERVFGFGEQHGGLDKRGQRLLLRTRDPALTPRGAMYVAIPFYLVHRSDEATASSHGVLLDSFGAARFDVGATRPDRLVLETDGDGLDLIVFPGPTPADVIARFTGRVGRTPRPPLWALGHHQSRWSYANETQVRRVAEELRERGIPTDAIHLDIDYMDGYRVFTWHPKRFPAPAQLAEEMRRQGFRLVAIVDPGVKKDPDYEVYREGLTRDHFCTDRNDRVTTLRVWPGDSVLPDFNRAEVRAWWSEQHRALLDAGVSGIWNDMNEPAGWKSDLRLGRVMLPYRQQDLSAMQQAPPAAPELRVAHERVRNLYGYQECRATRAALENAHPDERPFVLSRSGYAGIQRFAAIWTGDNLARWPHLRESIPMLLNLSLSGVAFCGADIGGFALSCTPELYARWIQLGAFYPFARTHSMWAKKRQEPWRFGPEIEAIAKAALEFRMALMPHLYGLFCESERSGAPVWRPLFYEFPGDAEAAKIEDQFMLGSELMVAPVVTRGARERRVYLPEGRWFAWGDDAQYLGPRWIRVAAPLDSIPLFARAGAIVPMRGAVRHAGEIPDPPLRLEIFPEAEGFARLVEDDGLSLAYQRGGEATRDVRLRAHAAGRLRLEIGRREGDFPIEPRRSQLRFHACPRPQRVLFDGEELGAPAQGAAHCTWSGGHLIVAFEDRGDGAVVEIESGA